MNRKLGIFVLTMLFFAGLSFFLERDLARTTVPAESAIQTNEEITPAAYHPVLSVADGDTIRIDMFGESVTVRIIGIDTPEVNGPYTDPECFGNEASIKMKELVQGKNVRIETDDSQDTYDKYDRLLAHVFLEDGINVGEVMIGGGFAREYTFKGIAHKYTSLYRGLEKEAQQDRDGQWGSCA